MNSKLIGKRISEVEVTQISLGGIWILIDDKEYFLPFEKFPWFKNANVGQIHNVQLLNGRELHWPDLNLNLSVESLGQSDHVPTYD